MKKLFSTLSTLMLTATFAFVGHVEADTSVQFGIGYRSDNIHWKTSTPDAVRVDTSSSLNFKDLEIFTIQGRIKSICGDCAYYRIDAEYGWVEDGTLRESDWISQTGQSPLSYSSLICAIHPVVHNDCNRKYVADFNIAIGYPLHQCWCPDLQIVPTLGFAYDTQRIRAKNRHCPTDELAPGEAEIIGLDVSDSKERHHNSFRTTWWGPWIGLDFAFCQQDCWNLYGELEFHLVRARRERNSNIGFDYFDCFRRTRSGFGFVARVGSLYFFRCNWFLDGHIGYKDFTSHDRRDHLDWRSYNVGLDIGYMF